MSTDKRERTKLVEILGLILFYSLRSDHSASRRQWRGQSCLPQRKPATQIFFLHFPFKENSTPTKFCLFPLQLALRSDFILSFHCSTLLAPWGASRVAAVKATQMRTEMGSPEVPRQTENSKHCFLPSNRPKGQQTK